MFRCRTDSDAWAIERNYTIFRFSVGNCLKALRRAPVSGEISSGQLRGRGGLSGAFAARGSLLAGASIFVEKWPLQRPGQPSPPPEPRSLGSFNILHQWWGGDPGGISAERPPVAGQVK